MSGIEEFGIESGDDEFLASSERFVADKRKYRISIIAWPGLEEGKLDLDAKTPRFKKCKRHYIKGVGPVLNKGPEWTKIAGKAPTDHVATVIIVWPTDENGVLDTMKLKEAPSKPSVIRVCPWVFGKDKYRDIVTVHSEFHVGSADMTLNCTETGYQRMSIHACKDSLLRRYATSDNEASQKVFDFMLARARELWPALDRELGLDLTLDQFRERMGGESTPVVETSTDEEIDDMIGDLTI